MDRNTRTLASRIDSSSAAAVWIHGKQRNHLQHVILNDIPNGACFVVEATPPLDTKVLGHGDLHTTYMLTVPNWLKETVAKPKVCQIETTPLCRGNGQSDKCSPLETLHVMPH